MDEKHLREKSIKCENPENNARETRRQKELKSLNPGINGGRSALSELYHRRFP